MKKSLLSGATAILLAMNLTGCGDDTKLETGTYACTDEKGKAYKVAFDMEKNTFDMLDATGKSLLMDNPVMKMANPKMTVGPYNDKTQEYELKTELTVFGTTQAEVVLLKRNGDQFEMKSRTTLDKATCKKEEK